MQYQERTRNVKVTLPTTSTKIAEACFQERTQISIINTSTGGETVSIGIGEEAVANAGIVIYAGGSYSESKGDKSDKITQDVITALGSAATATIAIVEKVRMPVR